MRTPLSWRWLHPIALALVLALVGPVFAAQSARAPAKIHPLLVGRLSEPGNPVWARIHRHAAVLSEASRARNIALTPESLGAYLRSTAANSPIDALATGALARMAVEPDSARAVLTSQTNAVEAGAVRRLLEGVAGAQGTGASKALRSLAQSPRSAPALRSAFDGDSPAPSLELDGIVSTDDGLALGSGELEALGHGGFGVVYAHPRVPGTVIKAFSQDVIVALLRSINPREVVDQEEATARTFAKAGVGPRYLGRTTISGRPVSVRERVFGEDIQALIDAGRFTEKDYALVAALLRRMAAARVDVADLHRNLMIGHTLLDPRRRAFIIDGSEVLALDGAVSFGRRFHGLLDKYRVIRTQMGFGGEEISTWRTLRQILLEDGLGRYPKRTRWESFLDFLWKIIESAPPPSH